MDNSTPRQPTSIRLPQATLDRADNLLIDLKGDDFYSLVGVSTRADVLRLAIAKGLKALEEEMKTKK